MYGFKCSPDGATLVFLSAHAAVDSGAHNATNSLHTMQWPADESLEITTVVSTDSVLHPCDPLRRVMSGRSLESLLPSETPFYCDSIDSGPLFADDT